MSHQLLAMLLPPVSYDSNASRISAELFAEGRALDRGLLSAGTVEEAITPFNATDLLADWERVCGLTPAPTDTYKQRRDAVLAKLRETGGLSIPYFIDVAARLGYTITITEFSAFYCDWSILDVDCVYQDSVRWCWQVNVKGSNVIAQYFAASESASGEALLTFSDPVIEAVFEDLKPAHTFVTFNYEDEQ